jgi:ubiquinone/menaquinone biosynthesis C-methylase UbiE
MDATPEQVAAGHAFYTRRALALYDPAILGFFSRVAWKCPSSRVLAHYDAHVSANHLDIGVGTGYFLDRCRFPSASPRVALMDPNANCLETARARIERYRPETYEASVLEPIGIDCPAFDSVGMNYLLHCLPGDIRTKGNATLTNVRAVTKPGGVVFGATLLQEGVPRSWFARQVMARNNRHGIFSNALFSGRV